MKRALVLLSGGMDSAVCLYEAVGEHGADSVEALFFDWGQVSVDEERAAARALCARAGVGPPLELVVGFPYLGPLTGSGEEVPMGRTAEQMEDGGVAPTFFPGRNIVMLAFAYGYASRAGIGHIYFGPNAQDEAGYPDCRKEFLGPMAAACRAGVDDDIELRVPLIEMSKHQVVKRGEELGVPWEVTFSCYSPSGGSHCGTCDACVLRSEAMDLLP